MTNPSAVPVDALSTLIAERTQYEDWIRALEARRDAVPAHILERVRTDYRLRLQGVLDRLSSHGDDLLTILTDVDTRLTAVEAQVAQREEARLEGELRALVGEYTPEQWELTRAELDAELRGLTSERDQLAAERDSLREIYEQVVPAESLAEAAPAATDSPTSAPAAEERGDSGGRAASPMSIAVEIDVAAPDRAARDTADPFAIERVDDRDEAEYATRGGGRIGSSLDLETDASPVMDPLGELGFLAPLPEPGTRSRADASAADRRSTTPSGGGSAQGGRAGGEARPADSAKTLRCQECGAMNYATEWYCERCGGELATL